MAVAPHRRRVDPRLEEERAAFQRYKQDVKERGKPFYPFAMFHDTVMSFVVVCVIIALACIWKWTSWNGETGLENGLLGPEYTDKADPGTTNFVPRPDWYFYFLFYLLRIFKWPESVFLGTVGIPTILLILAFLFPFLDRRAERRPSRRPVAMTALVLTAISMGVLTWKGATAKEALASEVVQAVPSWAKQQGFENNKEALAGARLFATSGCTACHTYLGTGTSALGAPDLSEIGRSGQGADFFVRYVGDPSQFGNNVMPKFKSLGEERLRQIAAFLVASKGPK
jgi:menaquinol-cytochrome c reductase cytochrome b/c subunit